MTSEPEQNFILSSRKRRIAAFLIDHYILTLIMAFVFIGFSMDLVDENNPREAFRTMLAVMIPGFFFYFAKDSIKGISIGRWILGIMVRSEKEPSKTPSFVQLFIRNLFLVIWPVEFIFMIVSPKKKRLGDDVAKTIVLENRNKPKRVYRILVLVGIAVTIVVLTIWFVASGMKSSEAYKTAIWEIEHNQKILDETGEIVDFGMIPVGNITIKNGYGQAELRITVIGEEKDVKVWVMLKKKPEGKWELVAME